MKIIVQHGKEGHNVSCEQEETIGDLMVKVRETTGIFEGHQKLIYKGKTLDAKLTLAQAKMKDGTKVMLIASSTPVQTQGQTAAKEALKAKAAQARERAQEQLAAKGRKEAVLEAQLASSWPERAAVWAKTGIAAMRDAGIIELPEELWAVAHALRTVDVSCNRLPALPARVSCLISLVHMRASHNELCSLEWEALDSLTGLTKLVLDHNRLTSIPECVGSLARLQSLTLSHNNIAVLPAGLGHLTALQRLDVRGNQLHMLPAELGQLTSLCELDASENALAKVPAALGQLTSLRTLLLDKNRLRNVPAEILRGCLSLARLSLHGNPLTLEQLRSADGFQEFNARRCASADKQIDMQVFSPSSGFDEGADHVQWQSWAASGQR